MCVCVKRGACAAHHHYTHALARLFTPSPLQPTQRSSPPPPPAAAGLAEHQLKELAYAIFLSCGGAAASRGLLADLRACLELNETRAAELARITELVGSQGVTSLATLEMHVRLLQVRLPAAGSCAARDRVLRAAQLRAGHAQRRVQRWGAVVGLCAGSLPASQLLRVCERVPELVWASVWREC